jgi:hypothetical protein
LTVSSRPGVVGGTIGAAFSATAWSRRHRPAIDAPGGTVLDWHALALDVRSMALGFEAMGVAVGTPVRLRAEGPAVRVGLLAAAAAGLVVDPPPDGSRAVEGPMAEIAGSAIGYDELRRLGAALDARRPDAYEVRHAAVGPDRAAVRLGGVLFSHDELLWAARSLVQAVGLGPDDRVATDLAVGDEVGHVVGHVAPSVSGACTVLDGLDRLATARPTVLVVGEGGAARVAELLAEVSAPVRRHPSLLRRALGDRGLGACRLVVLVGSGPVPRLGAGSGLTVAVATRVPGVAGLVTLGEPWSPGDRGAPLPGTSIGIGADGEVFVRSNAVAGWHGWVPTGNRGTLDEAGHLRDVAVPPTGR